MQNVKKGLIVRTISGHDKNEIFIVVETTKNFAYLTNGKNRPLDKPKRKNIKHIIKVGLSNEILDLINNNKLDNSQIIKVLKEYR